MRLKKRLQASHFVHIPGLSYSGVKSPTECQQSLFESHFASRQSLSDCQFDFSKVFFVFKFRVKHYKRGSIQHSNPPSIKLKKISRQRNTKNPFLIRER